MSKFRYVAVPFEAVARLHELTPAAALLYVHYCQWRNKKTGLAWPSLSLIASTMHIQKAVACRLRQQLAVRAWLEIVEGDRVRLLVGFAQQEENGQAQNSDETVDKLSTGALINCQWGVDNLSTEHCQNVNGVLINCQRHIKKNITKEQHQRTTPPTHPPLTTSAAPDGAGAGAAVATTPVYSLAVCREYAQHLQDTGQGVKDPDGLAEAIYSGKLFERHKTTLAAWLAARAQAVAQAAAAELEKARAAHFERYEPVYQETYFWPAVERFLLSDSALAQELRAELQTWDALGPREDLPRLRIGGAAEFFRQRPALSVLPFWDWDRKHNPQAFPQAA